MNGLIALLETDSCANLLTALLHSLWQAVTIAGVLLIFLRRKAAKEPDMRYAASLVALAAIVLCTMLTWSLLEYEAPASEQVSHAATIHAHSATTAGAAESGRHAGAVKAATLAPPEPVTSAAAPNWHIWAMCIWLIGVLCMTLRIVCVAVGGARLRCRCKLLEDLHIPEMVEQLRRSIGITRRIRVAVSEHISVPGVVGFIWPTLLIPVSMVSGVAADDLRAILAHELAHIRRYDYLVNFCQMMIEAIFFFNPALWWISKQIRFEREACCDKAGITATGQRIRYAEVLADWAHNLREANASAAAPAMGFGEANDSGRMLERVRRIVVTGHRPRLKVSWYVAAVTLIVSLAILIGLWRGTTATVELAGKLLTPQQRIDKMKEIAKTHDTQEPAYGEDDRIHIFGKIRMADGGNVPKNASFRIHGERRRNSITTSTRIFADGAFSTSIEYYSKVVLSVAAPRYAPAVSKTYHPEPGGSIADVELVLDKGFEGRIRFVNKSGEPITGTLLSGNHYVKTEGGWTGLDSIGETVSGVDGIAVLEHCIARPIKMSVRVHGYQALDSEDVELKPGEIYVLELADAEPASGIVVSRETGRPVAGAEISMCRKEKPNHSWSFGVPGKLLARTDDLGQFVLGSLNEQWTYTCIVDADGCNRAVLSRVNMGDEALRVELGPELHVSGRIIGDVNELETMSRKPIVRWHSGFGDHETDLYDNGTVEVEIIDGEGHFTIADPLGDSMTIRVGGKVRLVELAGESIDDFVIDLNAKAEPQQENVRQVVLEFETPEGSPRPEGEIRININSQKNHAAGRGGTSDMFAIDDGRITVEVPVPGKLSYDLNWNQGPRIAGYWFEQRYGIEIPPGDGPYFVNVPLHPAGAIYGQVLEADGTPAKEVNLHLMVIEKSPVMERAFLNDVFGHDKSELGKFNASPLPLGGEYMVVAYRGSTFVTGKPIKLEQTDSIHRIELKFVDGVTVSGTITDPIGKPFADAIVNLSTGVSFPKGPSWGGGSSKVTTSRDGRFAFENVNPKEPINYTLRVDAGRGYQNVRMKIKPKSRPIKVELRRGYSLSGVVLDDATGRPIPGARVYVEATEKTDKAGDLASAERDTDDEGRFHFSRLDNKRQYRLYLSSADIVNRKRTDTVTGGQAEQVTLRVKLASWSRLKPLEPAAEGR
ncbi:MAG: M56 family metallopeptidase [Planctomycetota bacterium]|jgi:beta-lactamase regulating signal transducer with metallopeptidase domain